jgi:hypothetical protein
MFGRIAHRECKARTKQEVDMFGVLALTGGAATLLWILAVILVISGIVTLLRGGVVAGVVLIIVGLLVGPGGVSIFK